MNKYIDKKVVVSSFVGATAAAIVGVPLVLTFKTRFVK